MFLHGNASDESTDEIEWEIFNFPEADAAFSPVELESRFEPLGAEPVLELGVFVKAHEVGGEVVFLGGESGEGERLLRVAVISCGIDAMRNGIADHSVLHEFHESGVEVGADDFADGLQGCATVRWEFAEVLSDGWGFGLHGG